MERYFRVKSVPEYKQSNAETIIQTQRPNSCDPLITVCNWVNYKHSFQVTIEKHNVMICIDSGVIEDLAEEIKKMKREKI